MGILWKLRGRLYEIQFGKKTISEKEETSTETSKTSDVDVKAPKERGVELFSTENGGGRKWGRKEMTREWVYEANPCHNDLQSIANKRGKTMEREFTITLNNELQGVEIEFDEKPSDLVLEFLKNNRFRWNRIKQIWYTKQTSMLLDVDSFGECLNNIIEKGQVGLLESAWRPKGTNTTVNFTPISYHAIIVEAAKAANEAGNEKIKELRARGPAHVVSDESGPIDTMLDLCGFCHAKIYQKKEIDGDPVKNLDFIKFFKGKGQKSENGTQAQQWVYETKHGTMRLSKSFETGFYLDITDSSEISGVEFQYIQPKTASYQAMARVLDLSDIICYVNSRVD